MGYFFMVWLCKSRRWIQSRLHKLLLFIHTIVTRGKLSFQEVNTMEGIVYIRLRNRVQVRADSVVKLGQLAQIIGPEHVLAELKQIPIHHVTPSDKNIIVIDVMSVIKRIYTKGIAIGYSNNRTCSKYY